MAARAILELAPEVVAEPVRLGVDQRVDELPDLGRRLVTEHDEDVAVLELQFGDHVRQRMAPLGSRDGHVFGAVRADDQDPALLDPPCEVKQQAGRRLVDPVQVVENQDQRTLLRDFDQDRGDLLEHATLVCDRRGIGAGCRLPCGRRGDRATLAALSGDQRAGLGHEPHTGQEYVNQVRRGSADHVLRDAQEFAQSPRVLARGQVDGHALVELACQHAEQLAERQVRVADARLRIARADCNEQVVVPLQRTARELDRQARLAEPRLTGYETDLSLSCDCAGKKTAQPF